MDAPHPICSQERHGHARCSGQTHQALLWSPPPLVQQLFMAVVIPKVEYALPVWFTPIHTHSNSCCHSGSMQHAREIGKIQREARKLITGAFCSTATDVLEVHANIPPVPLRLVNTCHHEALQLCTLPGTHPLYNTVRHAAHTFPHHHFSPLHILLCTFKLCLATIETIGPVRHHLNWSPLVSTHITWDKKRP